MLFNAPQISPEFLSDLLTYTSAQPDKVNPFFPSPPMRISHLFRVYLQIKQPPPLQTHFYTRDNPTLLDT